MIFEIRDDGHRLIVVIRRSNSVKTGFTGDDLEEDPMIMAATVGGDNFDVLDLQRREASGSFSQFLSFGNRYEGECERSRLQQFPAIYHSVCLQAARGFEVGLSARSHICVRREWGR